MMIKVLTVTYVAFVTFYLCWQLYRAMYFRRLYIEKKAEPLSDKVYIVLSVIAYMIYLALLIGSAVEDSEQFYNGGSMPFIFCTVPLMCILLSGMLKDNLYAYTSGILYTRDKAWDMEGVHVLSVKKQAVLGRCVIKVQLKDVDTGKFHETLLRTTCTKAEKFLAALFICN